MIEDLIDDDDSGKPPADPALCLPPKMSPTVMSVSEMMHRFGASLACNLILFTTVDEDTGEERWDLSLIHI